MKNFLNIGPQHPGTHGIMNVGVHVEGDTIIDAEVNIGYAHRGVEKLAENHKFIQFVPITNKFDYVGSMAWEHLYVSAVEAVMKLEVPKRAQYIRMMTLEIQRIISHLLWMGTYGHDIGQPTMILWCFRERERFLDLMEYLTGGRMIFNYVRFGGIREDIQPEFREKALAALKPLEENMGMYEKIFSKNKLFRQRTEGIGILSKKAALGYGVTGPMLRASGVKQDLRKSNDYLSYKELDFEIPTRETGDCLARFEVRFEEIKQSINMVKQILSNLPEGPIIIDPKYNRASFIVNLKANGEAYVRQECARGEGGVYIVCKDSMMPYRVKLRSPCFSNLSVLSHLLKNCTIADAIAIIGNFDLVFGEVDR